MLSIDIEDGRSVSVPIGWSQSESEVGSHRSIIVAAIRIDVILLKDCGNQVSKEERHHLYRKVVTHC